MRLPRDISGERLTKALKVFGYSTTRQTGSHMRLTTQEGASTILQFLIMTHYESAHWREYSMMWQCISTSLATT
jgi:hypothetical protein